jgi:hypothetical protein
MLHAKKMLPGGVVLRINAAIASSFFVLCLLSSFVAAPLVFASEEWSRVFEADERTSYCPSCVIQTSDHGYAIAGSASDSAMNSIVWLIKCDSSGNKQWNYSYGIGSADPYSVIQTSDGGYLIVGTQPYYTLGYTDAWLIKTDSSGQPQWNKTLGAGGPDRAYVVVQVASGGCAFAGETLSESGGDWRQAFWLVKIDASGNIQWNKTYNNNLFGDDIAYSMALTNDGGYALAGYTQTEENKKDFFLVKTDSAGNKQWSQTYGTESDDIAYSVVQTQDGGYALAGYSGSVFASDFWLVKTDSAGNMQWNQRYGGPYPDLGAYSVVQTDDGGYALAGGLSATQPADSVKDFGLVRTDPAGNQLRNQTFGGSSEDYATSMVRTDDGAYVLAGYSANILGGWDVLLVKTAVGDAIPEFPPWSILFFVVLTVLAGALYRKQRRTP